MEPNGTVAVMETNGKMPASADIGQKSPPGLIKQQSTCTCGSTDSTAELLLLPEEEKAIKKYKNLKLTALTFMGISFVSVLTDQQVQLGCL